MSGDAGIFGPDSVAWRIHADPVMLIGGLRALLVQALEPRAMAAVDQHSAFREDPWGRLERTTHFVLATTYGDTAAAEAAARARAQGARAHPRRRPRHRRSRTRPTIPTCCCGSTRSRSSRSCSRTAPTPGASTRTTATATWPRWRGSPRWSSCPPGRAPRTEGELREYLRSVRGLQATPAAFDGLRVVLFPPMDLKYRPLWAIPTTAAIAILPGVRRAALYRIPWFPPAALPVRTAVFALSRVLNLVTPTPPSLREARDRVEGRAA